MMRMKTCLCLILLCALYELTTAVHVDDCNLQASEFGPDWYKVPRPIPTGFENNPDYQNAFVHMPCAATTVFDIAVCGCTNPMTSIYNSLSRKKPHHVVNQIQLKTKPLDLVRVRDPVKKERPIGTRLLNVKTGEVRHCPFRASSRGPEWYLVHEPTGTWRPMRCAPGTLFQKRSCTCVHRALLSKTAEKPENNDIVVLEEEYENHAKDDTISKSLGISVADVDFSKRSHDDSVPFWRRISGKPSQHPAKSRGLSPSSNDGANAVFVTLDKSLADFDTDNRFGGFDLGKDKIADEHRELLKRLRKGPISNFGIEKVNSPLHLDLDSKKTDTALTTNSLKEVKITSKLDTFVIPDKDSAKEQKPFKEKVEDSREGRIRKLNEAIAFLGKHNLQESADNGKDDENSNQDVSGLLPVNDEIYFAERECPKRPLPERGPQWFQFYVWGVGRMAYTCHGNLVYDDKVCACVPAHEKSTINEINIPLQECNKEALPELGPEYYKVSMWQVGHVAVACHGNRIFDQYRCACVPRWNSEK